MNTPNAANNEVFRGALCAERNHPVVTSHDVVSSDNYYPDIICGSTLPFPPTAMFVVLTAALFGMWIIHQAIVKLDS